MRRDKRLVTHRVTTEADRVQVMDVLRQTYAREKGWIAEPESQIPASDLSSGNIVWFVTLMDGEPVGVLRIFFDPPVAQYAKYGLTFMDPSFKVDELIANSRIAEVGRFAVVAKRRGRFNVATSLMSAAFSELIARDYTHLVTDVFEDDPHSPYGFHTRVIGFQPIATHEVGELMTRSRRITLVLDISAAYRRLRERSRWLFLTLTRNWTERM
ncbi:MAG: N-acyl amino acid synthase FeeM domain-containing protein, partial [Hyphomicrobiaceae bacterium]